MRGLKWSHLAIHMCSSGSAPLVNMKTITQSKLLITGWGPDQVIVHLYKYWFMLMLTLFSLYSYSASYNRSESLTKNPDTPMKPFSNTTGVLRTHTLLPPYTHTHTHIGCIQLTNTSIDAIETDRQRNWGVKVCVCTVCLSICFSSCLSLWRCLLLIEDIARACWVSSGEQSLSLWPLFQF